MKLLQFLTSFSLILAMSLNANARDVLKDTTGLSSSVSHSPAELLRGQIAGVRVSQTDGAPGSLVNVSIRGTNSFSSDRAPLWVVDGVMINPAESDRFGSMREFVDFAVLPSPDNLSFLSAYDIESIEVLKNASATALYGSSGANGVIIVKTKTPGKDDGKSVDVRSNAGVDLADGRVGFSHSHYLGLNGSTDNVGFYVSGFLKDKGSPVQGNRSRYFGARIGFDTFANNVVRFGMKAQVGAGSGSSSVANTDLGYVALEDDFDNSVNDIRVLASVYLNFNITKSLSWKNVAGIDYDSIKRYLWYGSGNEIGAENEGVSVIPATNLLREHFNSSLNYSRYFGRHHVSGILAFDQQLRMSRYNILQGASFFTEVLRSRGISLSGAENLPLNYHNMNISQYAGSAQASYDYNSIAGLDASFRADFTPRYYDGEPVLYPAAQAYFNVDKLIPSDNVLSTLRIEGGYGTSGKDDYDSYNGQIPVQKGAEPYYESAAHLYSREFNVSLKSGFLSDRLVLSATYYNKTTEDSFEMFCFGSRNFGKRNLWNYSDRTSAANWQSSLRNSGFEFDLSAAIIRSGKWKWDVGANFATNENTVLEVASQDVPGSSVGELVIPTRSVPGYPVYSIYGTGNDGELAVIGNPVPKYYGGLSTMLAYSGFCLEAVLDGAAGFDILDLPSMLKGQIEPYSVMEKYVHKGDYLRLSRLSVSYRFKRVGISLSGTNLFTLTTYGGLNPDVNSFGYSTKSQGVDCGCYPAVRSIMLGVNLKF